MLARGAVPWVTYDHVLGELTRLVGRPGRVCAVRGGGDRASPPSPFREAFGGLLLGSEKFVARIQGLLGLGASDAEVPARKRLRSRPSLEQILQAVARHFGHDPASWWSGHRSDDASRGGRLCGWRRFGYSAKVVAAALGYRDASGVSHAIRRIEAGIDEVAKWSVDRGEPWLVTIHYSRSDPRLSSDWQIGATLKAKTGAERGRT